MKTQRRFGRLNTKEVVMEIVRRNKTRESGEDSILIDEEEVEKSFWLSRPDHWVINRKRKKIILLFQEPGQRTIRSHTIGICGG